jgi:hypothetical protein
MRWSWPSSSPREYFEISQNLSLTNLIVPRVSVIATIADFLQREVDVGEIAGSLLEAQRRLPRPYDRRRGGPDHDERDAAVREHEPGSDGPRSLDQAGQHEHRGDAAADVCEPGGAGHRAQQQGDDIQRADAEPGGGREIDGENRHGESAGGGQQRNADVLRRLQLDVRGTDHLARVLKADKVSWLC